MVVGSGPSARENSSVSRLDGLCSNNTSKGSTNPTAHHERELYYAWYEHFDVPAEEKFADAVVLLPRVSKIGHGKIGDEKDKIGDSSISGMGIMGGAATKAGQEKLLH